MEASMPLARRLVLPLLVLLPSAVPAGAAHTRAFVVTTDFVTGGLSAVDVATRAVSADVASVHSDAIVRWHGGLVYVVNRFGQDNIQVIDPAQNYATVRQFSVGNGTNPQDIAFVSPTKAYVSRLGSASLLIVNPQTGSSPGVVSLAEFAGGDGLPDAARMLAFPEGGLVFVVLQRLTNFLPTADSAMIAVIDATADTVIDVHRGRAGRQAIVLHAKQPFTEILFDATMNRLLVGCAGAFGQLDGGIESIPMPAGWPHPPLPEPDPAWESAGVIVPESALGGDVLDIEIARADRAFAIVSDAAFNACVRPWNAMTGEVGSPIYCPGGFSLADCEVNDRDELWVCNNSFTSPGIRIFHALTGAPLAGPLPTGLPPFSITFDETGNVVADAGDPGSNPSLSAPRPNPARGDVSFALALASSARVRLDAFDLSGRRVRAILDETRAAGSSVMRWDLTDERGARVAAGIYFVRADVNGRARVRRVVVLER
jgi:DNA-binding beta-propeller fold protein YncE